MLRKMHGTFALVVLGFFLFVSSNTHAFVRTKIEGIKFTQEAGKASIHFTFNQKPSIKPEIMARGNILQFTLKDVIIWPRIEKQITLGEFNVQLLAYQFNKDEVRVRAIFPHELSADFAGTVNVGELNKEMMMSIGDIRRTAKTAAATGNVEKFDEKYLEKLTLSGDKKVNATALGMVDKVKNRAAGTAHGASKFTLSKYILKFSAFLALVLVLFYGIVALFKRGVLGKNRLGLLTMKEGVVVLSTTHLAPKKSLVLIKAHTQVFLLSSTDSGISLISEIQNVPTLIKNGERETTGINFDTTLNESTRKDQDFRIKDVQVEAANRDAASAPVEKAGLAAFLNDRPVVDEVKISDKIKSKVKSLRAFQ